ncbi:MAG: nucleotidyltransferase family protein [Calditrichaeota bacterium]|nr:nucleotidyltransferase family protein [Calditrichota bacterium]
MLSDDFRDFLNLLNQHGVRYLVVGAFAVAVHGYPRNTGDIDIWIERTPENARKVAAVLGECDFGSPDLTDSDFLQRDQIIQLGLPPNRIDILTGVSGASFGECYPQRVEKELDGVTVAFVGRECLRRIKKASARSQDLADLENLGLL